MLRRSLSVLTLALALAVGACQRAPVTTAGGGKKPATSAPAARSSATAAPTASATPRKLVLVPPADGVALAGLVTVDAGYLLANNGAAILANNGGSVVVSDGAGIVSDHGGGIVSDHGGGLVANNGGNLTGKVKRGLLAGASLPLGTQLPAAGMQVQVLSMADGKPLAIMRDDAGADVFSVPTDADGRYTAYVPKAWVGNVRVEARVPGSTDPRLALERVTAPAATADRGVDDLSAQTSRYLRRVFTNHLRLWTTTTDISGTVDFYANTWKVPAVLRQQVSSLIQELHDAAAAAHVPDAPLADQQALAQRLSDVMLSVVDLDAVLVDPSFSSKEGLVKEPAVGAMRATLLQLREATAAKLQADPHFFEALPYLVAANAKLPAEQAYHLVAPADLGDFMVEEYLVKSTGGTTLESLRPVFASVGAETDPATGMDQPRRLVTATKSLGARIGLAMTADEGGIRTRSLELVAAFGKTGKVP